MRQWRADQSSRVLRNLRHHRLGQRPIGCWNCRRRRRYEQLRSCRFERGLYRWLRATPRGRPVSISPPSTPAALGWQPQLLPGQYLTFLCWLRPIVLAISSAARPFQSSSGAGSSCDNPTTGVTDMLPHCFAGGGACSLAGGTSFASPIFAGMVALMNQEVVVAGGTEGLGNINSTLYSLAATTGNFNAVTTGAGGNCTPDDPNCGTYSNGIWCTAGQPTSGVTGDPWPTAMQCPSSGDALLSFNSFNYDATTNYSLAVGLGSPNAGTLIPAVLTSLSSSVTFTCGSGCTQGSPVSAGQPQTYTFSVAPAIGSTFAANVSFSCSFSPADPTLTNSACTFTPSTISAGATGSQTIGLSMATSGPDAADNPKNRKRADNHMPILPFTARRGRSAGGLRRAEVMELLRNCRFVPRISNGRALGCLQQQWHRTTTPHKPSAVSLRTRPPLSKLCRLGRFASPGQHLA